MKLSKVAICLIGVICGLKTHAESWYFVQITDTHRGRAIHSNRLEQAIAQINALDPAPLFVVHTGDFASDNLNPETAAAISNDFARIKYPVYKVPGNHDILPQRVETTLNAYTNYLGPLSFRVETNGIQFLFLYTETLRKNIKIPDYDPIQWLATQLNAHPKMPTIVVHHAPVAADFYNGKFHVSWAPEPAKVWNDTINTNGNVKAVICGHFHRDELHFNDKGIPTYVAAGIAMFWSRQGTFRIYRCDDNGNLSYSTVYIEDPKAEN